MGKQKRKPPPPSKPGITRQHLIDVYNSPPVNENLKNGHVLYLYCNNSVPDTVHAVCSLLPESLTTDGNKIRTLGTKYKSFKKPKHNEWNNFVKFCDEQFEAKDASCPIEQSTSGTNAEPQCVSPPVPSTSSFNTGTPSPSLRDRNLTPRKRRLKERLTYVSKQRVTEKERHSEQVRNLKSKLHVEKFSHIKYLKQDIKRKKLAMETKNAKITLLKAANEKQ